MGYIFLLIGRCSLWCYCHPLGVYNKKISEDIGSVTRNLLHNNPEWNLTAVNKVCSIVDSY